MEAERDPWALEKGKLYDWARWVREAINVGYPPHSWEGRAMLRGGSAPNPGMRPTPTNLAAERIERYVVSMPPDMQTVVREHYLKRGSLGTKLKATGLARGTYFARLTQAYVWIRAKDED